MWDDIVWSEIGFVIVDHNTLRIQQELSEVPSDVITLKRGVLPQVFIPIQAISPVDVNFSHHWKLYIPSLGESLDLLIGARLLFSKLIARETYDLQAIFGVFFVDLNKLLVVRGSQTSF